MSTYSVPITTYTCIILLFLLYYYLKFSRHSPSKLRYMEYIFLNILYIIISQYGICKNYGVIMICYVEHLMILYAFA